MDGCAEGLRTHVSILVAVDGAGVKREIVLLALAEMQVFWFDARLLAKQLDRTSK